jgi:hypothetical protein
MYVCVYVCAYVKECICTCLEMLYVCIYVSTRAHSEHVYVHVSRAFGDVDWKVCMCVFICVCMYLRM